MNRLVVSLTYAMLALPGAADADEFPVRKPGLWETVGAQDNSPPLVTRYCADAASERTDVGQAMMKATCPQHSLRRDGDTVTQDGVCKIGSIEVTSHSVTTLIGDAAYNRVTTSHYNSPVSGARDTTLVEHAKWIGPCPPNQRSGEVVILHSTPTTPH